MTQGHAPSTRRGRCGPAGGAPCRSTPDASTPPPLASVSDAPIPAPPGRSPLLRAGAKLARLGVRFVASVLAALLLSVLPARADPRVVVLALLGQPETERVVTPARIELSLRSFAMVAAPAPTGLALEERSRRAEELRARLGAHAVLWLEAREAHAVLEDGTHRYASLPDAADRVPPRVVALIASSILDEPDAPIPAGPSSTPSIETEPATSPSSLEAPAGPASTSRSDTTASDEQDPDARPPTADEALDARAPTFPDTAASEPRDARAFGFGTPGPATDEDGPRLEMVLDAAVGAAWAFGAEGNVAHLVQRLGAGMSWRWMRGEVVLAFGLEQGMDGGYPRGPMGELTTFLGARFGGDVAFDTGLVSGLVLHGLRDGRTEPEGGVLASGRLAGAVGLSVPRDSRVLPFRARLEVGLFARFDPSFAAPFTNVVLGIAFR